MKYGVHCCALSYLNNEFFSSLLCFREPTWRSHFFSMSMPVLLLPLLLLFGMWINKLHFDQSLKQNERNGKRNQNESWHFNRFQLLCIAYSMEVVVVGVNHWPSLSLFLFQNDNNNKRTVCPTRTLFVMQQRIEENKCKPCPLPLTVWAIWSKYNLII